MANIPNSTWDPWLNQFRLTGYPDGIDLHGISQIGMSYQVTSAQLLALNTTAVSIVAAPVTSLVPVPPNGYCFMPVRAAAEYVAGTTAYTLAGTAPALTIVYHGQTTALLNILVTGFLNETTDMVTPYVSAVSPSGPYAFSACQNLGLDLILGGTATPVLTLGNGYVNLFLEYGVICLF